MKGTKHMKTQLALRVHEDVAVRHERPCCMRMLADRALYDWLDVCVCVFVCECV